MITRPEPDDELIAIARYVTDTPITSSSAYDMARACLLDALACAMLALHEPDCMRHVRPIVPGTVVPHGSRVPGTSLTLDPVQAAFALGCLIRWLDFNDTWLAAEWGHPSDNLGALLAVADYVSRAPWSLGLVPQAQAGQPGLCMRDVLTALIKAYEIQGVLALENSLNRRGFDHVWFVKIASTAVVTGLLGGRAEHVINALSNAWIDGPALRTYRQYPNTGARKSWAAADATSRAVRLALMALNGEMGYPSALTAPRWGVYDVLMQGQPLKLAQPLASYVVEHILFKVAYPAEFHAQTAIEAAIQLHPQVIDRLDAIEQITITTHEAAIRIIDKTGPLHNPADRDHCLQYMVALGLLFGTVTSAHYQDDSAADPRIDRLRACMVVLEDPQFSRDYLDPQKRAIANTLQIRFGDGSQTEAVTVQYPLGHPRRRAEGMPLVLRKWQAALHSRFGDARVHAIDAVCQDQQRLEALPVADFLDLLMPDAPDSA
ncbi:MAG: bifunctional 2-methylcitrate dehydratase/aconitate hydratase [Chloroflexaceae bacterium]|nr:bifunctional 2-methylcitrate dehydratase/aconitate hydratase [Chloroflexaceae bacterium]